MNKATRLSEFSNGNISQDSSCVNNNSMQKDNKKLLVNKQMIKTGITEIPNLKNLEKAINKKKVVLNILLIC